MFNKLFFHFSLFLVICNCYSQKISGNVSSNGNFVEYASIIFKTNNRTIYTNEKGEFTIENFTYNDTILVQASGYSGKEIVLINNIEKLKVELEHKSQTLDEVIISINNNEKSKWEKVNKKTKRFDSSYQGLAEGYMLISSYKIKEELKFNGIRLFIMVNTLNTDGSLNKNFKKKTRPILIINSDNLEENILPNKVISLNNDVDKFTKLDIEFKNTIHLLPNETLTIGLELIPQNENNPNFNNVMGVLTTKYLLPESTTFYKYLLSKETKTNIGKLNEDIYFELKVVK